MRTRLVERGVPVTDLHEGPGCTSCSVTDPEENRFAIHQAKSA
jgi:hypothetical protein